MRPATDGSIAAGSPMSSAMDAADPGHCDGVQIFINIVAMLGWYTALIATEISYLISYLRWR
jgi:nucleoside permease NupC